MQTNSKIILKAVLEFIFLTVAVSLVPLIVALDTVILGLSVNEYSYTEYSQELLLLILSVSLWRAACRHYHYRPFLVLMAGGITSFLVRECDIFLDFIYHDLWQIIVALIVLPVLLYSMKHLGRLRDLMANFLQTKSYSYFLVGLIMLLAFSRLFGTGKLWIPLMGDDYDPHYKSVIQEGLELLGYVFISYGIYLYLRLVNTEATANVDDEGTLAE